MPFKIVIGDKPKSWKLEVEAEALNGKSVGDKISGKDIKAELEGYELEITGGSDISGFPMSKEVVGLGLKALLLKRGWGMWDNTEGMKRRKTVRGKVISSAISQINMKVVKHGSKPLSEVFPDQNKAKEAKPEVKAEAAPAA